MNGSQQSSSAAEFLRRLYHNNDAARSLMSWPAALRRRLIARQGAVANAIAERLSENLVGDVVLSLPAFSGTFAVSAKSDLFRRVTINGEYESDMAALVSSRRIIRRMADAYTLRPTTAAIVRTCSTNSENWSG